MAKLDKMEIGPKMKIVLNRMQFEYQKSILTFLLIFLAHSYFGDSNICYYPIYTVSINNYNILVSL